MPAVLVLLGPEPDRLLAGQLPALFEQRRLTAGHQLPQRHLQRLRPALVAQGPEVQHFAAVADPAFSGRERRSLPITDVHGALDGVRRSQAGLDGVDKGLQVEDTADLRHLLSGTVIDIPLEGLESQLLQAVPGPQQGDRDLNAGAESD